MKIFVPLVAVAALLLAVVIGIDALGWRWLFGAVVPYAAAALFLVGFAVRVLDWARSPVPFRIPTTCGQQRSLPWIRQSRLESPFTTLEVVARMALEVLTFRSLFRNTKAELREGRLSYISSKWLWIGGMAFHWALLVVLLRHLRFATEPIPGFVLAIASVDGFMQIGLPTIYMSTIVFVVAGAFLFLRRVTSPPLRYLSLPADYFPLFLLLAIGGSGIWLRHVEKVDVRSVKMTLMSLMRLAPQPAATLSWVFYAHLFLVCTLLAYFPFSKLMHMGGVFLSPTRNLANNNRAVRHVNPWNRPLPVHTYAEYEDEFRDRMRDAGLPLDKEA